MNSKVEPAEPAKEDRYTMGAPSHQDIPEPEGFIARAIINCLRQWQAAWGPAPFYLDARDVDCLEQWAENLRQEWMSTADSLKRVGIEVRPYPVKVKPKPDPPAPPSAGQGPTASTDTTSAE